MYLDLNLVRPFFLLTYPLLKETSLTSQEAIISVESVKSPTELDTTEALTSYTSGMHKRKSSLQDFLMSLSLGTVIKQKLSWQRIKDCTLLLRNTTSYKIKRRTQNDYFRILFFL